MARTNLVALQTRLDALKERLQSIRRRGQLLCQKTMQLQRTWMTNSDEKRTKTIRAKLKSGL